MSNEMKVALGIVVGAAAGAITALLVAPTSGKKLRKEIADESARRIHDIEERVIEAGKEYVDRASKYGEQFVKETKDKLAAKN